MYAFLELRLFCGRKRDGGARGKSREGKKERREGGRIVNEGGKKEGNMRE